MERIVSLLKETSQSKQIRTRKLRKRRKPNDPIRTGILIFLILVLVMASIATFAGGVLTALNSPKASVALLVAFVGTLRMEYDIIKRLLDG